MKRLFFLTIALICMVSVSFAQESKHSVGGNLLYGNYSNLGIGVKYQYTATSLIRIEPSLNLFFPTGGTVLNLNGNVHFTFPVTEEITCYPLAGLTFLSASGNSKFGINLGGGADYKLNDQLKLDLEAKYQIIDYFNQFIVSVGVTYSF